MPECTTRNRCLRSHLRLHKSAPVALLRVPVARCAKQALQTS
jgi:hypothetical protein